VRWWCEFIKKQDSLSSDTLKKFDLSLRDSIVLRIKDHWYPELPCKGQGYRSLTMDKKAHCDPALMKAAVSAGITEPFVNFMKDVESINMWIDPDAVIVRISYTGYLNIPPEEKVLHRSQLSLKSAGFPFPKVGSPISPPQSPNRRTSPPSNIPIRPPSPPQVAAAFNVGAYRSSSPGLTSASAPYIPYSHSSNYKNPFLSQQQRNGVFYNNNGYNQAQYPWFKVDLENNWNENSYPQNLYQNGNFPTSTAKQAQQILYSDYYGPELPLETQA